MTIPRTLAAIGLAGLALGAAALPAQAAPTVVAKNLDNPRGLTIGLDGSLYVAEAGKTGKTCLGKDTCVGFTGSLDKIGPDGKLSILAGGILSAGGKDGTFATGVDDVALGPDGSAYGIMTSAPPAETKHVPAAVKSQLGRVVHASGGKAVFSGPRVDTIEFKKNPDHTDVNSNPYSIAIAADGTQYVADAGGNTILQIKGGKVSLLAVIPALSKKTKKKPAAQPVPTTMRIGPDGALYIGTLGGDGTPKDGSKVFRLVPGGKPTVYAAGFRNITGLAFGPDGSLYVSELYRTIKGENPNPDGDVVKVAPDSTRTRIGSGELPFPAGVAVGQDGSVYVSAFSVLPGKTPAKSPFKGAGGQILKFAPA